jgi:hypothetical protein
MATPSPSYTLKARQRSPPRSASPASTPPRSRDYGNKAKQALSDKVFGKTVTVKYSEKDRYGRTIGDIYLNGDWINLKMVSEGWAWHYKQYSSDKQLAAAEIAARRAGIGLWADPNQPVPPWEHGRAERNTRSNTERIDGAGPSWLNSSSGTRHNSSCKYFKNTKRGRICGPNVGKATGGSKKTVEFATKHGKPVLHIAIDEYSHRDCALFVKRWFAGDITKPIPPSNCTLNVAGSRESKSPGIQHNAMNVMIEVINAVVRITLSREA